MADADSTTTDRRGDDASLGAQAHAAGGGRVVWLGLLLIAGAALLSYASAFDGGFMFDDYWAIVDNPTIRELGPNVFSPPRETTVAGRPFINLSFAINYALTGLDPWGLHAGNLLIHVLAGFALFGIVRRTLRLSTLVEQFGPHANGLALAIALLWVVHPLQTESVTYLVQRAESLAGLLYLGTFYAFIRYMTTTDTQASSRRTVWGAATLVLCMIGMASKETMATAPIVLLLYDAILNRDERRRDATDVAAASAEGDTRADASLSIVSRLYDVIRCRGVMHGMLFATIAIAIVIALGNPRGDTAGFGIPSLPSPITYLATQAEIVVHYLVLVFWPASLCLDYNWQPVASINEVILPGLLLLALLLATLWAAIRCRPIAFLGIWFFVILAPTSSFVPIYDLAFEHRMYLSLAAPIALVVSAVYRFATRHAAVPQRRGRAPVLAALCAVVVIVLGAKTFDRNKDYASAETMWLDVMQKQPDNARAIFNYANARFEQGDLKAALKGVRKAIQLNPKMANAHNELGILLSQMGQPEAGLASLQTATTLVPNWAPFHYNLGTVLSKLGRDEEAEQAYKDALLVDPAYADAHYNLGNIALRRGDYDAAAAHFRKALEIAPRHVQASYNMGGVLFTRGDKAGAQRYLDRAYDAAIQHGIDMRNADRPVDAAEAFQMALQIRPEDARALQLLEQLEDAHAAGTP